ncbi:OmcA/MtrC family decaheme c-type cytochrome [Shewanella sp. NIFS-20-20]|uniref:OmcA/MtrC family decaheme c-type cytochrome n=1 Tax=Shewanella sp. NIFS-20-20 TaxID=2853806 RepID=UPI001C458ED5|nr:OmcA/MtrC family decaheme c-type cytochrome [Shewanella sp. NIFS-20-20]MBV7316560.1 OmcA/MtrC family decaheme c-type cytochrome [Shewanella sp. NIFS-20-20]
MMKHFSLTARSAAFISAGIMSLALVGCGGDDGEPGKDGVIGVAIDSSPTVLAKFTSANVENGTVSVDFTLENANGVAVLGLTKEHDLRFGVAQLTQVTETTTGDHGGDFNRGLQWQAYINTAKTPGKMPEDLSHLNPGDATQAAVESANKCDTCLIDNGDGSYRYTFQQNIANVTTPVEVTYDADATQRVTLELELPQTVANAHHDWQPSTGLTEGIASRDVVSIQACYTCHQPDSIALHGGRRIDIENCAACHTATSGDPESGNSVDFTYMIHAIHKGASRTTVNADKETVAAPYKIVGYGGKLIDYGKVMYPQTPAADCAACHVEGEGAPANADLFKADLSSTACIGCHTEKPSSNHSDSNCVACHNATDTYFGTGNAEKRHGDVLKGYKASLGYSAKFSNIAAENGVLTFDVQVLDNNQQPVAKEFIGNPSNYTKSSVYFSWDIDKDYPAYESGSTYSDRGFTLTDANYNAETKTFSITSAGKSLVLPDLTNKNVEFYAAVATCFNQGGYNVNVIEPTACTEKNVRMVYIQDQPLRFKWNGVDTSVAATERRAIVDTAKCSSCHNQEIVHYDNGVNCQACHTPDKGLSYSSPKAPTSFAYKAHHAEGHFLKYSGVSSGTVIKTDCATCHTSDSKTGEMVGIKLGRVTDRAWQYADKEGNPIWASSDAGTCLSCHQKYLSDAGKNHIESFGGIVDASSKEDAMSRSAESCSTCHTPEQVLQLHGN